MSPVLNVFAVLISVSCEDEWTIVGDSGGGLSEGVVGVLDIVCRGYDVCNLFLFSYVGIGSNFWLLSVVMVGDDRD